METLNNPTESFLQLNQLNRVYGGKPSLEGNVLYSVI